MTLLPFYILAQEMDETEEDGGNEGSVAPGEPEGLSAIG